MPREGRIALALSVLLVGGVHAANFTYKFGEQTVNLGWPHATADWHAHHIPSHQDANYYNMKNRYDWFLAQAKQHLKEGLKRAAVQDLMQAVAVEPYQPYARRLLAHALMSVGDYSGSLEQFRRAKNLSYNFQRLDIEWREYSRSQAHYINDLEALRDAAVADPNNPVPIFLLGIYRYYDEKYSEALGAFQRAQLLRPHDQDVNYFVHAAKRKLK